MYYNYYQNPIDLNKECSLKGICSVNPTLSALQEFVLMYLKETAFYLLELKNLGIENKKVQENIMEALSGVVIGAEYSQYQFQRLNVFLSENLTQAKNIYKEICQKHNFEQKVVKSFFRNRKNYSLSEAIKIGEKFGIRKNTVFSPEQKHMFDTMLFLLKSMCIKTQELKSFGGEYNDAYLAMLSLMNSMNLHHVAIEASKNAIKEFMKVFYEVVKRVYTCKVEAYGVDVPTEVSFSTVIGKAILVSGNDLKELELVLRATQGKEINVYTHGLDMLIAHTFPKLKAYRHLVGHFGRSVDACIIDFATFPGPILMTRHALQKTHDLYRGNLFTTDIIPPRGAIRIIDNDFAPLVETAQKLKGFSTVIQKKVLQVGFDEEEIKRRVNGVLDDFESGKIKHIYFAGLLNNVKEHSLYFDEFFDIVSSDCFVFSLSYNVNRKNVYHINSNYDYTLVYKIFREMQKRKPLNEIDITLFVTRCDKNTISNVLNFKHMGIKNIFMCDCPSGLVNPRLIDALRDSFDLKAFTHPKEDLEKTLSTER